MKGAREYLDKYLEEHEDDGFSYENVQNLMASFARAVIDEMVSRGDKREDSLIYSDGEFDLASNTYDALYNYDRIDEFKKNLK